MPWTTVTAEIETNRAAARGQGFDPMTGRGSLREAARLVPSDGPPRPAAGPAGDAILLPSFDRDVAPRSALAARWDVPQRT